MKRQSKDGVRERVLCRAHRGHIASLHAEMERMRDPSIPRRARRHIRRAAEKPEDTPGLTPAEQFCLEQAIRQGYEVHRAGWPDFLLIHKQTGQARFIQVENPSEALSSNQITLFRALSKIGIEVEIFRAGKPEDETTSPWQALAAPTSATEVSPQRRSAGESSRGSAQQPSRDRRGPTPIS